MKRKSITFVFASLLLAVGTLSFVGIKSSEYKEPVVTESWDLNVKPSVETTYYSAADGKTGSALRSALAGFNKPTNPSYDWSRYEAADEAQDDSSSILCLYTRHNISKNSHCGTYSWNTWNREHVYTQSAFPNSDKDNHNIFACEGQINNYRGNLKFAEVKNNGGERQVVFGHQTDCYRTSSYFEPCDEAKGEVARACLYCSVYYGYTLNDIFDSIDTCLEWNAKYTVTAREVYRNNVVHGLQGNRNPFIDRPSYAKAIYGGPTYEGVDPLASDSFVGVTISPTSTSVATGNTVTLTAIASDNSTITWTTSSSSIATVNQFGVVTGVNAGTATITASATINSVLYTADATITVTAAKALSSISVSGQKTSFNVGDTFSFGGTVTAHYSDSTTANVTASSNFSGYDLSTEGNQTVTVSYTEGSVTKTITYNISVTTSGGGGGGTSGSQRISARTGSNYYQTGDICPTGTASAATATCDAFDVSWLKNSGTNSIVYTYDEMRIYSSHSFTITPKENYTISSVVITANNASYATALGGGSLTNCSKNVNGSTVTLTPNNGANAVGFTQSAQSRINYIVVNYEGSTPIGPTTLDSIEVGIAPDKTVYYEGEYFDPTGLEIRRNYSDGSFDLYEYEGHESEFLFGPSLSIALGTTDTEVEICYADRVCYQDITVKAVITLSSISLNGMTQSYSYGSSFSFDGTCTATYSDNSHAVVTPTSVSTPNMNSLGQQTVTVTYTEGGVSKSTSYTITISDVLSSITVSGQTTSYFTNDVFSFDGTCTAHYLSGASKSVTPTGVSSPDMSTAGNKTITVTYTEGNASKQTTYNISVQAPVLQSISVSGQKTDYYVGDDFVKPTVTATYNNGNVDVTNEATFTGYDLSSIGNQQVTVSFGGKSTSYSISVSAKPAVSGYVKVKSSADITSGDYLIVYEAANVAFNGGLTTLDATNNTISVTISNDTIASTVATDAAKFTINTSNNTIRSASGYYIGRTSNANGLNTSTSTLYSNTMSIDSDYNFVANSSDTSLRYNASTGQNRFRYYKNAGQNAIQLYKLTSGGQDDPVLSSISLSGEYSTSFFVGDSFSHAGLVVTAHYDDGSSADVSSYATFSGYDMSTAGEQTVTVSFTQRGVTETTTYTITVTEVTPPQPVGDYSMTVGSPYINGVAYYMYFTNTSTEDPIDYYFTGDKSGNYGTTSTLDHMDSFAKVYFEASGNGQNMYFFKNGVKTYLSISLVDSSYRFTYGTSIPSTKWIYQTTESYSCITYDIGGTPYTFGTFSTYTTFGTVNLAKYPTNYLVKFVTCSGEGSDALPALLNTYISCDSSGNTAPSFSEYSWNQFALAVSSFCDYDKNAFISAEANPSGTAIEQFVARYDYIVGKYQYNDFLGRNPAQIAHKIDGNLSADDSNSMIIIVTIAAISAFAFTTLLVIKKKKRY